MTPNLCNNLYIFPPLKEVRWMTTLSLDSYFASPPNPLVSDFFIYKNKMASDFFIFNSRNLPFISFPFHQNQPIFFYQAILYEMQRVRLKIVLLYRRDYQHIQKFQFQNTFWRS